MATTQREEGVGGGRGRDNKRPSISKKPSSSTNTTNKRPINTTSSSTSSSTKPVPNYLKPTFSSRLDPSPSTTTRTTPRRPIATSTPTTKPSLDRRRTFDTRDTKTSRATSSSSSSTSSKTSVKPTRGPQRSFSTVLSRSSKPAVATSSIRRSVSTRVSPVSSPPRPVKKSGPKSVTLDSSDIEACDQDPLDSMIGSQDDPDEMLSLADISEMPDQAAQLGDPVMILENRLVQNDEKIEASEAKIKDEHNQESGVEDLGEGVVEEEEEESTSVEEKHVVVDESEEEKQNEEQVVKEDESPTKQDMSTHQSGSKKEAQDYNEVIEETANKLMENKRNKVRALAGAFETVISLQDPK